MTTITIFLLGKLMMVPRSGLVKATAAVGILCAVFVFGWWLRGVQANIRLSALLERCHAERMDANAATAVAMAKANERMKELQRRLALVDEQHLKAIDDAKSENDKLRADLRTGARRVSVAAHCAAGRGRESTATSPTRLDDETSRAELDAATAEALAGIAADGDAAIHQLMALQEWVGQLVSVTEGAQQ